MLPGPAMQTPLTCASACLYTLMHENITINAANFMLFVLWLAIIYWQPEWRKKLLLTGF